ncbi:IclR family transcriptional regulator [Rudaeicoccus suwonensis]|uniref:IclR family transcriptional regulator n=1 Tax=Rudaeicoccus suwonensis TaxID=657409 RepID=A0A561E349_9MICO|nr:IclR family transcriptional regulator [Rudaeicoccus suwonensis]TWE10045.1 IclR family transcriptional regulator [Rudaeicoccus suwonensis]
MPSRLPPPTLTTKTLEVLGAFDAGATELTLSELARRSGLPLTTTHRIVRDLLTWGAIELGADGRYCVGLRLWELAALGRRGPALREIALPVMEDLYEATHENVQLAVREGTELVYIERLTGRRAVPTLIRVGGRFALHATGVGLVLLAFAPTEVQQEVLSGPLERWTPHTISDPASLRRALAEVRRVGYARSMSQVTEDALSIACPVRGADDAVVAALSLVVHADTPHGPALLATVRAAARAVSRELGAASATATTAEYSTPRR